MSPEKSNSEMQKSRKEKNRVLLEKTSRRLDKQKIRQLEEQTMRRVEKNTSQ